MQAQVMAEGTLFVSSLGSRFLWAGHWTGSSSAPSAPLTQRGRDGGGEPKALEGTLQLRHCGPGMGELGGRPGKTLATETCGFLLRRWGRCQFRKGPLLLGLVVGTFSLVFGQPGGPHSQGPWGGHSMGTFCRPGPRRLKAGRPSPGLDIPKFLDVRAGP